VNGYEAPELPHAEPEPIKSPAAVHVAHCADVIWELVRPPVEMVIPPPNVFVALFVWRKEPPLTVTPDEVARNPEAVKPEYKVEVPDMKFPTDCTERIEPGVVVPMPRLLLTI